MTRRAAARALALGASLVLAALGGTAVWFVRGPSARWLVVAVVAIYLLPWAIACVWAPGRCREILLRLALASGGIAVVVLTLETAGVAGLANYPALLRAPISEWWYGPPHNVADPDLLYVHRPYLRLSGTQPGDIAAALCLESPAYRYDVRYDRNGFRNDEDLTAADVVVIGDSFIEAPTIPTPLTVTSALARLTGRPVANLGMSAYGPQQELVVLGRFALALRPAALVWAFYEGNDLKDMARYEGRRVQVREEARRRLRPEASLTRNVVRSSHRLLRGCVRPPVPHLPWGVLPGAQGMRMHLVPPPPPPPDDELRALGRIFTQGDAMARQADSRLIVVFIPTSFRVYHDLIDCRDCERAMDDLAGRIERMLSEVAARVEYLDLTPALRAAARGGELVYRPDDTHWTQAGHRVAAEAISRHLTSDPRLRRGAR